MPDEQIVLERWKECRGRCGLRVTKHRLTVYKDSDHWLCEVCGHKEVVRYETASQKLSLSDDDIRKARQNLMGVVGDMQTRRWSKGMGDKDKSFIQRVVERLIGIGRDLTE